MDLKAVCDLNFDISDRYLRFIALNTIEREKLIHSKCFSVRCKFSYQVLHDRFNGTILAQSVSSQAGSCLVYYFTYAGNVVLLNLDYNDPSKELIITVYSISQNVCDVVCKEFGYLFPPDTSSIENIAEVLFWAWGGDGVRSWYKDISVPIFNSMKFNYGVDTKNDLKNLIQIIPDNSNNLGKLILWQGVPGTGKTWALRALLEAWKPWCNFHYIVDADAFFNISAYFTAVFMGGGPESVGSLKKQWNLLILEDAGEYVTQGAHLTSGGGQSLAKLLNVTDGLIGQGLKFFIIITTNTEINKLEVSASRPGRLLSRIQFGTMSLPEAEIWAKENCVAIENLGGKSQYTLAELYNIKFSTTLPNSASDARKRIGLL